MTPPLNSSGFHAVCMLLSDCCCSFLSRFKPINFQFLPPVAPYNISAAGGDDKHLRRDEYRSLVSNRIAFTWSHINNVELETDEIGVTGDGWLSGAERDVP